MSADFACLFEISFPTKIEKVRGLKNNEKVFGRPTRDELCWHDIYYSWFG